MKKVLLTLAPVFWPKMPPLGIAYLQSFAAKHGIGVDLLDLNNYFYSRVSEDLKKSWLISCNRPLEENIFEIIKNDYAESYKRVFERMSSYDIVGFSCFKSNFKATLAIARALKESKPRIEVIFGGPEIARLAFKSPFMLEDGFDGLSGFSVVGEGEGPFLSYLNGTHQSQRVVNFSELDDLSQLPFPAYSGLDLAAYPRKKSISILSSRGCVRACRFCSERLLYRKFRTRPVVHIMEELSFYKKNGVDFFVFHDSMINADMKHLEGICESIRAKFGPLPWEAQLGIDERMPDSLFRKIEKSGCYNLFIGLESGCDRTLKNMNKGFTTSGALAFFERLHKAGLFFGVSMIVGFPGETEEDFYESLGFIVRHKNIIPKIEQVNPFVYYEGTDVAPDLSREINTASLKRYEIFTGTIKKEGIRHTNAFLGNLMEKKE